MLANDKLILALPKGRILEDVMPLVRKAGIEPEAAFNDPDARQLSFATNEPRLEVIRVRSIDMATLLSFGAAHFGVAARMSLWNLTPESCAAGRGWILPDGRSAAGDFARIIGPLEPYTSCHKYPELQNVTLRREVQRNP